MSDVWYERWLEKSIQSIYSVRTYVAREYFVLVKINLSIVVIFCLREYHMPRLQNDLKIVIDFRYRESLRKHTEVSFRPGVPTKWAISCENRSPSRKGTTERARTFTFAHRRPRSPLLIPGSNRICVSRSNDRDPTRARMQDQEQDRYRFLTERLLSQPVDKRSRGRCPPWGHPPVPTRRTIFRWEPFGRE